MTKHLDTRVMQFCSILLINTYFTDLILQYSFITYEYISSTHLHYDYLDFARNRWSVLILPKIEFLFFKRELI